MAIKATINYQAIEAEAHRRLQAMDSVIINNLAYLGEMAVNYARSLTPEEGSYKDQTGNLRSSIGYAIFRNGEQITGDYEIKPGYLGGGAEGQTKAQQLATMIGKSHSQGYILVVVAGMEYASIVEAKNKDVLTGATRLVEDAWPAMRRDINQIFSTAK